MSRQSPSSSPTSEHYIELSAWARRGSSFVAVVCLIVAGFVLYNPPASVTVKQDGQGQVTERTTSSTSDSAVPIVLFGAAIGLLLFALNGLRLARFSAGGVSVESASTSNVVNKAKAPDEIDEKQLITDADVISEFRRIPGFSGFDLVGHSSQLKLALLYNGITTKRQLEELN